ncbi:MAG TPA: class I tRNA ligase family protein, partial [Streptosporangiaceae bacterium]
MPRPAAIEDEVLARWMASDVPGRSLRRTAGERQWNCEESPAAAYGMPGLQHVPGMTIRDLYQRFKTMQGFGVPRRAGWNCHGLPVEIAVERELGLSGKADISEYGVERFVARCRESALRHVEAFSALITRMGCWEDLDQAYRTMDPGYIESVWWSLRHLYEAGLLSREYRVVPYCPRCQTPLSGYEFRAPGASRKSACTAVTVRFRLLGLPDGLTPWLHGADLLVRTEQAWTLVPAAAIAVHPHQVYAVARRAGTDDRVVVSEALVARVLGEGWHIVARVTGADLAGARYQPFVMLGDDAREQHVISGYFVPPRRGTGLVLVVPAFGSDDLRASQNHEIGVPDPIGPDGCFGKEVPLVGGVFFAAAEPILIDALADRGLLFGARRQERSQPHCWRCGAPLLTRAMSAWYLHTGTVSERLAAGREHVRLTPGRGQTGGSGRSGTAASPAGLRLWPAGDSGWAVSRSRYWGTPLPLWECEHGHLTCVGSLAELSELAGLNLIG